MWNDDEGGQYRHKVLELENEVSEGYTAWEATY